MQEKHKEKFQVFVLRNTIYKIIFFSKMARQICPVFGYELDIILNKKIQQFICWGHSYFDWKWCNMTCLRFSAIYNKISTEWGNLIAKNFQNEWDLILCCSTRKCIHSCYREFPRCKSNQLLNIATSKRSESYYQYSIGSCNI